MAEDFKLDGARPAPELGDAGEFFADFIDYLRDSLLGQGIAEEKVGGIVIDIVCKLSGTFAGESFYVSKKPKVFVRQMAMYADLQYMPHYDVDKKYGVSRGYSLKVRQGIIEKRQHRQQLRISFDS